MQANTVLYSVQDVSWTRSVCTLLLLFFFRPTSIDSPSYRQTTRVGPRFSVQGTNTQIILRSITGDGRFLHTDSPWQTDVICYTPKIQSGAF